MAEALADKDEFGAVKPPLTLDEMFDFPELRRLLGLKLIYSRTVGKAWLEDDLLCTAVEFRWADPEERWKHGHKLFLPPDTVEELNNLGHGHMQPTTFSDSLVEFQVAYTVSMKFLASSKYADFAYGWDSKVALAESQKHLNCELEMHLEDEEEDSDA